MRYVKDENCKILIATKFEYGNNLDDQLMRLNFGEVLETDHGQYKAVQNGWVFIDELNVPLFIPWINEFDFECCYDRR